MAWRGTKRGFWGSGDVTILHPGGGYMSTWVHSAIIHQALYLRFGRFSECILYIHCL